MIQVNLLLFAVIIECRKLSLSFSTVESKDFFKLTKKVLIKHVRMSQMSAEPVII